MSIGPRQMIGWSGSTRKPNDISLTPPAASTGRILPLGSPAGISLAPIMSCCEGP